MTLAIIERAHAPVRRFRTKMSNRFVRDTDPRWRWLSTVASLAIVLSFVAYSGLLFAGVISLAVVTKWYFGLYCSVVLASVTYIFGRETLEVVYKYRNGGFDKEKDE